MRTKLGIDIGGTKIFAGRFYGDGFCVKSKKTASGKSAEKFFFHLFEAIDATILDEHKIINIAFAGPIFENKILGGANFPFFDEIKNFPKIVAEKYGRKVKISNDAHAFARGEAKLKNAKNLVGITLGTGVGVGLFLNGEIFAGNSGIAGEIARSAADISDGKFEIEHFLRGKSFSEIGHEQYFTAAANFFANVIFHFDPEIIAIGGGFGQNGLPKFLPKIERKIDKIFARRKLERRTKIVISENKNAGAFGATIF